MWTKPISVAAAVALTNWNMRNIDSGNTDVVRAVHHARVCTNCVMDTTDPQITFDERGICDHCRTFYREIQPNWDTGARGERELQRVLAKIKKAGERKEYDCIIGMSGGIDSSYLLYLAKEQFNLRPLVFHVDAGWNSQEAVNNIERLIDGLALDLHTEVIDWEEMRDLQLAFFKSGVPHIDTPQDHAFFATMYRFAERHDVRYILTGANYSTECIRNPMEWMYYQSDSTQIRDIHRRFGTRPLRRFPMTSILWHKLYLPHVKGIRVARLLDFVPYEKGKAIELLEQRFGWQRYPQKHFESRFTRFYEGYWLPERFGYDTRKVQYSSLILTVQMTREEALDKLREPPLDPDVARQEFDFVARKLNVPRSELMEYFKAPKRTYRDYRSQQQIYAVGRRALQLFGGGRGGKR